MKNGVVSFIFILCACFLLPCLGCTAQNKIPSDEPHDQSTVSDNSWTQPDNSSEAVCSQLETIFGTWYGFDDSDYITIYENGEYVSTRFGNGVFSWEEEQLGSNLISDEGLTIPFLMRCFEGQDIFTINNMYFYCKDKSLGHSLNTDLSSFQTQEEIISYFSGLNHVTQILTTVEWTDKDDARLIFDEDAYRLNSIKQEYFLKDVQINYLSEMAMGTIIKSDGETASIQILWEKYDSETSEVSNLTLSCPLFGANTFQAEHNVFLTAQ